MARGGAREGAGRKPGTPNKRTAETMEAAAEGGELPLDYMLKVMRDTGVEHDRRDRMATAAAPYVHAKLAAATVEHTGKDGEPLIPEHSDRQVARAILSLLRKGALSDEPDGETD